MLNLNQFRDMIVRSTLNDLLLDSDNAQELLIFTCAVESEGGTYIHQINGPALGIYQMEPATHNDIWQNYIHNHTALFMKMLSNFGITNMPSEERMIYDLRYATAMAAIHYYRVKEILPNAKDENAIWEYYKKYYNTSKGAAEKESAMNKYHVFLGH